MATVLLIEDEPRTRERLAGALRAASGLELAGAVGDVSSGLEALQALRPDAMLTDLDLPDGSGVELIAHARQHAPSTQIMVITIFGDERNVMSAIEAGAAGYLLKDGTDAEIAKAVHELLGGGSPISPSIARHLLRRFQRSTDHEADAGLSVREREVLDLVTRGYSATEIARALELSPHTVRTHVRHIYQKLEVTSRGEAVYQAARRGLISLVD